MSHPVEINNTIMEMLLETVEEINADSAAVLLLYRFLKEWQATGEIKEIRLTQNVTDPNLYSYQVERLNGDSFLSTMAFTAAGDLDPIMTVILNPGWRLSVLQYGIPIRKQIIEIRALVGLGGFNAVFSYDD